ncbi:hypothetical protein [Psychrosphaera algicola]|uniref:hypothetical protein n=1 Tax=Psychrosphaera algicola TaxID=3023714 RepID=UPI002FEE4BFD
MESGEGNSRAVTSNQTGVHDDLVSVVDKHLNTQFKNLTPLFQSRRLNKLDAPSMRFCKTIQRERLFSTPVAVLARVLIIMLAATQLA